MLHLCVIRNLYASLHLYAILGSNVALYYKRIAQHYSGTPTCQFRFLRVVQRIYMHLFFSSCQICTQTYILLLGLRMNVANNQYCVLMVAKFQTVVRNQNGGAVFRMSLPIALFTIQFFAVIPQKHGRVWPLW